jgi:hypothetical protein
VTTSEMRAALAAEQALIQKVIAAVRAFPLGHSHWDSTMQYGRGCELCIRQQKAKEDLMHSLTEAPAKAVAALATPSVASPQDDDPPPQCAFCNEFSPKHLPGCPGMAGVQASAAPPVQGAPTPALELEIARKQGLYRCMEILEQQAKQKRLCAGNPDAPEDYAEALQQDADTIEQSAREMERAWYALTPALPKKCTCPRKGRSMWPEVEALRNLGEALVKACPIHGAPAAQGE